MTLLLSLYLALISPLALPSTAPSDSINIEVRDFMRKWKLRGMQVCAMKDGEIVLDRAYGWADVESGQHMDTGKKCASDRDFKEKTAISAWGNAPAVSPEMWAAARRQRLRCWPF